jgi:hypothetical protein
VNARGRKPWFVAVVVAAVVVAACTPSLVIKNETSFGVLVIVTGGGKTEAFRPSPGESSSFEFGGGSFSVIARADVDWVTQMTQTKQALNALIADFQAHQVSLTSDQVDQVIAKLREIDSALVDFRQVPNTGVLGGGASCNGTVTSNSEDDTSSKTVEITVGTDDRIYATC